ncbi:hypothetical protein AMTRI_Chr02g215140 [Amborella trichopoda]
MYMPSPHTGDAIAAVLMDLLLEWKIENNFLRITLDNASYNDVVASSLVSQLSRKSALLLNGKMFHMRCCAHILNLIVQDGVGKIKTIIDKIREIIKFIRGSQGRQERFNERIQVIRIESKKNMS